MQYQALRKEASSKLMLFAVITTILVFLATFVQIWLMMNSNISDIVAQSMEMTPAPEIFSDIFLSAFKFVMIIVMIPALGVASLIIIALFLIYANARSNQPLKRTGYTIMRGMMIAGLVCDAFGLFAIILTIKGFSSYRAISNAAEGFVTLLIAITSVSALKTAKEVVVHGSTYRRISNLLPILLIVTLCVTAGNMILVILANTMPALTVKLVEYRLSSAPIYYVSIANRALQLIQTFLFILLCFRGKNAISQQRETPVY